MLWLIYPFSSPLLSSPLLFSTTTQVSLQLDMRIACLLFNPELGRLPENIARANALLEAASPQNIDLLVLPELAFTGRVLPLHLVAFILLTTIPSIGN